MNGINMKSERPLEVKHELGNITNIMEATEQYVCALESQLTEANQLINDLRKLLASTDPGCAAKEALIQIKQYKVEQGV